MKENTSAALVKATQSIENLMNAVQRDTLMAVIDELHDKIECYTRLMENGSMIMETLSGHRLQRMLEKRSECWKYLRGLLSANSLLISKL